MQPSDTHVRKASILSFSGEKIKSRDTDIKRKKERKNRINRYPLKLEDKL